MYHTCTCVFLTRFIHVLCKDWLNPKFFAHNPVRLVGGISGNEGRVELYYNNAWGTICDDEWGIPDADVVCRMMGFYRAESIPLAGRYGLGRGQIILDTLMCNGTEDNILDCEHDGPLKHNCDHEEDATVICLGTSTCSFNLWFCI